MEDPKPAATPAPLISFDSTLVVAAATLWLYLVASAFTRGYLGFFACDAAWFDPSIFQLISFGQLVIMLALAMAAVLLYLSIGACRRRTVWVIVYLAWLACLGTTFGIQVAGTVRFHLTPPGEAAAALGITYALTSIGPLAAVMGRRAGHRSGYREGLQAGERHRSLLDEALAKNPETTPEEADLISRRLDSELREEWEARRGGQWVRENLVLFTTCMFAIIVVVYAGTLGAAAAAWDVLWFRQEQAAAVRAEGERPVQLIFSDGVRTLTREIAEGRNEFYYNNPEADLRLVLRPGRLGWRKDQPTTAAAPAETPH